MEVWVCFACYRHSKIGDLTLCILVTCKCILWQTVETLMEYCIIDEMPHHVTLIRVDTVF